MVRRSAPPSRHAAPAWLPFPQGEGEALRRPIIVEGRERTEAWERTYSVGFTNPFTISPVAPPTHSSVGPTSMKWPGLRLPSTSVEPTPR